MFSVNQNRQLYVVKAWKEAPLEIGESNLVPGDCYFSNDGKNYFFQYVNAKGEVIRTDLINPYKINYVRTTAAEDMLPLAKSYTVAVSDDLQTDGKVPAGKHYILRLNFSKMVGISDEERGMVFGDCYTYTATDAAELLKKLALSLVKNIAADKTGTALAEVKFGDTVVTPTTDLTEVEGDELTITEVAQPWTRGKRQFAILPFTVSGNTVTVDGVDIPWVAVGDDGLIPMETVEAIEHNGKLVADLEWFCAGEKGDQYRGMGYPNDIETEYMVDPDADYNLTDISYFYSGDNEDVQHSSKVITLAVLSTADAAPEIVANWIDEGKVEDSEETSEP